MALVAYDCSDHSGNDESDDDEPVNIAKTPKGVEDGSNSCEEAPGPASANLELPTCSGFVRSDAKQCRDDDSDSSSTDDDQPINLSFSTLPKPQYDTLYVDESKLKTAKSKIWKKLVSLPRADKTAIVKRKKGSITATSKKSGLLSLLPTPTCDCESTKTIASTMSNTKLVPRVLGNKPNPKQTAPKNENDDENSDSDTDFFSLSKIDKEPEYDPSSVDLSILDEINAPKKPNIVSEDTTRVSGLSKFLRDDDLKQSTVDDDDTHPHLEPQSRIHLDEDAVLKLCGRKRKGQIPEDIEVIDIHEDNVLAETRKNLTKRLTEEVSYRPARSGASTLSKRKHQITYLAFQAKERELELKNQWAQNRFNKKQTQSKYGF